MAKPETKKKIKGFKEFDAKKYIELEPTLEEAVKSGTVVMTFGRMNPMTIGHEKLVDKIIKEAKSRNAEPMVFLSHSSGAKSKSGKGAVNKDPLSYDDKIKYATKAFGPVVKKSPLKILMLIAKSLSGQYKNLVMVAGSDRVDEYNVLLNKYNGKDYTFDSIEVISAGQRDADGEGAAGMSGTKMREFAAAGDVKKFASGLPKALKSSAQEIMDKVANAINPSMDEEVEVLDEVLDRMQRRKRGIAMKKARFKIKRGREKAAKRTASQEVLKKRAKKAAINIFKAKFAKNKRYADLSPGEKEVVEKRIAKINKSRIEQIARKLLPKVKQKERDRRKSMMSGGSSKNESINEASIKDQRILQKPHMLLDKDNKPKVDGRFRMFKKKSVNESVEDLSTEVLDLMEATEQFNEATIPDGKTAMTKREPLTKSDTQTMKKLRDMMSKEKKPVSQMSPKEKADNDKKRKEYNAYQKSKRNEEVSEIEEGGLWANIHAKRKRIKNGSGESMKKPGSKGAPTDQDFKDASESIEETKIDEAGYKRTGAERARFDSFKRKEMQHELGHEDKAAKRDKEAHHVYINGKVWKKDGKPLSFSSKAAANKSGSTIAAKDPKKDVRIAHHTYHAKNGDNLKEEGGAGDEGTPSLLARLKKDTPKSMQEAKIRFSNKESDFAPGKKIIAQVLMGLDDLRPEATYVVGSAMQSKLDPNTHYVKLRPIGPGADITIPMDKVKVIKKL
tara:strand:+ start:31451 stop:33643 length:2193 start_codon:yes stop_codon:yes gene_type:complete